jgi:hypothetical protein
MRQRRTDTYTPRSMPRCRHFLGDLAIRWTSGPSRFCRLSGKASPVAVSLLSSGENDMRLTARLDLVYSLVPVECASGSDSNRSADMPQLWQRYEVGRPLLRHPEDRRVDATAVLRECKSAQAARVYDTLRADLFSPKFWLPARGPALLACCCWRHPPIIRLSLVHSRRCTAACKILK